MSDPLSSFQPLTIMLSSRCSDKFLWDGRLKPLSELRLAIKEEIEKIQFAGKDIFKVWIHEKEPGGHSWDECMANSRKCDLFIALCNGNSGWNGKNGKTARLGNYVGICHAELDEAFHKTPDKVRCIHLLPLIDATENSPDAHFQEDLSKFNQNAAQATSGEQAIEQAKELAVGALMRFARSGAASGSKGSFFAGEALEWVRLDFQTRRKATRTAVMEFLQPGCSKAHPDGTCAHHALGKQNIAFVCDCIPSSMGTAAARELVGQPFLIDWKMISTFPEESLGPVHLIACQKGVSESQAIRQLGFPDATVVSAPFGVYVADPVQCIQMVFLPNCRDETSTHERVQRFLMWLDEQGEEKLLIDRARSRRVICEVIAAEATRRSS